MQNIQGYLKHAHQANYKKGKTREIVSQVTTPEKRKRAGCNPCVPQLSTAADGQPLQAQLLQLNTRQMQKQLTQTMSESEETRSTYTHMYVNRDTGHPHQFSPGQRQVPPDAGAGHGPPTHTRRIAVAPLSLTPVNSPSKSMLVAAAEHRSRHRPCKGKSSLGLSSLPLKAVSRADEIRHVDPSGPVQAQAMCCTCMSIHRSSPSNGIPPHPRTAQRKHGFQSP